MTLIRGINNLVQLTRPLNVSGSILTFAIGYALANQPARAGFIGGLTIILLLHSLGTVQNDLNDRDVDAANTRRNAILQNHISINNAKRFLYAAGMTAVAIASFLPNRLLHLTMTGLLLICVWAYNNRPFQTSRKPITSILTMSLCYGMLPFAYGHLTAGGTIRNISFIVFAAVFLLARFSTAVLKDYKDATGDRQLGKITFYLRYGKNATALTSLLTAAPAYLSLLFMLTVASINIVGVLGLVLAVYLSVIGLILRYKLIGHADEKQLNILFHQIVFRHNQLEAVALACLIISFL